ncbi:MAG: hypothetical protein A3A88_02330 [Nitrospirae bacterium RIFCSPLOWO2_01_FULL_62_17]|nr:MAG: hypothetical protein A3A88_02330 [Nitrospirae bacterium RIFCSPLOWO2_01_FULL_62_17]
MNHFFTYGRIRSTGLQTCRLIAVSLSIGLLSTACTTPGAVAPSTMPSTGKYVELGPLEESESCGYLFFLLPVGSPDHISDMIDALVKSRGGDALIDVTSSSSTSWFLLGGSNCVQVKGKVVKFSK